MRSVCKITATAHPNQVSQNALVPPSVSYHQTKPQHNGKYIQRTCVAMQHDSEENTYAAEVLTLAVQVNCSQSHEILFSTFTSS
jgi:hypothetical protein